MKARVKATGKYIEVEQRGSTFLNTNDGSLYNVKELDLNVVDDMMSEQEKWYWKDKHIQASIAAMQSYISDGERMALISKKFDYDDKIISKFIAEGAVMYADALIAELQKKGGQDE